MSESFGMTVYVFNLPLLKFVTEPNLLESLSYYYYIQFQYVVGWWKIIFQKSKRPQTHLLMSFDSIRIMAGYTFSTPKINM